MCTKVYPTIHDELSSWQIVIDNVMSICLLWKHIYLEVGEHLAQEKFF